MTTQINQLTELTSTSDGDLFLIRDNATGVDKKMQASNLRAKATTKDDVGLGDVDNVSAANLRDRSTHTGTQPLSTISDAGTIATQDANSVNIDGGTIDGTAVNATNLAYTGTLTGGTGVVNLGSGQVFKDANGNIGVGLTPSAWRTANDLQAIEIGPSLGFYSNDNNNAYFANNWFLDSVGLKYKNTGTAQVFSAEAGNFLWLNAPSGTAGDPLTFQERMRIDSSGHAIIPAGVTLGTSAGVYNAANTLDDYEEGTWTGVLRDGSNNAIKTQTGNYRKVGKIVFVSWDTVFTSGAGDLEPRVITGLPFSSTNTGIVQFGGLGTVTANRGFPSACVRIGGNTTEMSIRALNSGVANFTSSGAGTLFGCSLVYMTS